MFMLFTSQKILFDLQLPTDVIRIQYEASFVTNLAHLLAFLIVHLSTKNHSKILYKTRFAFDGFLLLLVKHGNLGVLHTRQQLAWG